MVEEEVSLEDIAEQTPRDQRELLDQMPAMLATIELPSCTITQCNASWAIALGYERDELYGMNPFERTDDMSVEQALTALRAQGSLAGKDLALLCHDGAPKQVRVWAAPRYGPDGELQGSQLVAHEWEKATSEQPKRTSVEEIEEVAALAAHDLQEPLRRVSSYVEALNERLADQLDDKSRGYLAHVSEGVARMRWLTRGLLDLASVKHDNKPLEPIHASAALQQALENLALVIDETGARVHTEALPRVLGCQAQLVSLFQNLLLNAIRHGKTAAGETTVFVGARRAGMQWEFSVADNGVGMSPAQQQHVFTLFGQGAGANGHSGGGMGLSIAKRVVDSHGGEIWLDSKPESGTVVYFTLPALPGSRTSRQPGSDRDDGGPEGTPALEDTPSVTDAVERLQADFHGHTDSVSASRHAAQTASRSPTRSPPALQLAPDSPGSRAHRSRR